MGKKRPILALRNYAMAPGFFRPFVKIQSYKVFLYNYINVFENFMICLF